MEDHLLSLLVEKERELQNVSKLKIQELEETLGEKEKIIEEQEEYIEKLLENYNYNLKLLAERDEELKEFEKRQERAEEAPEILKQENAELKCQISNLLYEKEVISEEKQMLEKEMNNSLMNSKIEETFSQAKLRSLLNSKNDEIYELKNQIHYLNSVIQQMPSSNIIQKPDNTQEVEMLKNLVRDLKREIEVLYGDKERYREDNLRLLEETKTNTQKSTRTSKSKLKNNTIF